MFRIVTFNANGVRSALTKGFFNWFQAQNADVLCIQELKAQEKDIPAEVAGLPGYQAFFHCAEKKGYSGTAVFSRVEPLSVRYGLGIDQHDHEGRAITLEYEDFFLVNVYVPNSQDGLKRLDYRMQWEDDFRAYVQALDAQKPVIICGDMNVAHTEIDLKNPKTNRRNAGFTDEERAKMTQLLEAGFVDSWRSQNPGVEGVYSWWSYRFQARQKNAGWRIDYFLVSQRLMERVTATHIYTDILGSDHCPVGLELQ
mgnify:CR=1 FL=1